MRERHLRLVRVNNAKILKDNSYIKYFEPVKDFIDNIFISKNEKIYLIKDSLIKIYKDYEETTGIVDIPYFVRAERRIIQMIKDKKIDYYYKKFKKYNNLNEKVL